jgi:hypothetical protein
MHTAQLMFARLRQMLAEPARVLGVRTGSATLVVGGSRTWLS